MQKLKTRDLQKLIIKEKCFYHNVQCEIVKTEIYLRAKNKRVIKLIRNQSSFE